LPTKTKTNGHASVTDEDIQVRAYHLWEADGRPEGKHDHYWHVASKEMKAAPAKANGAKKAAPAKAAKAAKPVKETPKAVAKPVKAKLAAAAALKPTKKASTKPRGAVPAK
jgi:Protein of unknown function (DUF2934)